MGTPFKKHSVSPPVRRSNASNLPERPKIVKNTPGRKKAQAKYNSKPEQKERRAARGRARYEMEKKGLVRKGDGKDIDHKDGNPQNNSPSNLRVQTDNKNRSMNRRSKRTTYKGN
jgi:hypothetical protein